MNMDINIFRPFDLQKAFKEIEDYIKLCEEQKNKAIALVEKWNKDKEIQKLKTQIKDYGKRKANSVTFIIEPEEITAINDWIEKHTQEKHNGYHHGGTIGGSFTYKFTPSSIGEVGEIICNCGEEFCFRELC